MTTLPKRFASAAHFSSGSADERSCRQRPHPASTHQRLAQPLELHDVRRQDDAARAGPVAHELGLAVQQPQPVCVDHDADVHVLREMERRARTALHELAPAEARADHEAVQPRHHRLELVDGGGKAFRLYQRAVHDEVGGAGVSALLETQRAESRGSPSGQAERPQFRGPAAQRPSPRDDSLRLDHVARLRLADDVREVGAEAHRAERAEERRTAVVPAAAEDADAAWGQRASASASASEQREGGWAMEEKEGAGDGGWDAPAWPLCSFGLRGGMSRCTSLSASSVSPGMLREDRAERAVVEVEREYNACRAGNGLGRGIKDAERSLRTPNRADMNTQLLMSVAEGYVVDADLDSSQIPDDASDDVVMRVMST